MTNLPNIGELVELYFFDGHTDIASREFSEQYSDQWHWETPCNFIAAGHPLITKWEKLID